MEFFVDIIHPTTLQSERVEIEKSIDWSEGVNRAAPFGISLVDSIVHKKFKVGRIIKIYRGKELVFSGVITSKSSSVSQHSVKGIDLNGILARRFLINTNPDEREGSAEIKTNLDNYVLVGDLILDADTYLEPSVTSIKWSWYNDTIDKFLTFIAERCLSPVGQYGYTWRIDQNAYLHFAPEGSGKVWTNLPIRNIVQEENIDHVVNDMDYTGRSGYFIPSDGDSWTEQSLDGWGIWTFGTSTLSLSGTQVVTGESSLKFNWSGVDGTAYFYRSLKVGNSSLNLEKINFFHVQIYEVTGSVPDLKLNIEFIDSLGGSQSVGLGDADLVAGWTEITLYKADFSGAGDWGDMVQLKIGTGTISDFSPYIFYLDNLYIEIDEQSVNATVINSQSEYGRWQAIEVRNEINKQSYLTDLATNYVNYLGEKDTNFNFSLRGYWGIKANDKVSFSFEDEDYISPVSSVQHWLNDDGSETTKIFLGRQVIQIEDVIGKMREIQRIAVRNKDKENIIKL